MGFLFFFLLSWNEESERPRWLRKQIGIWAFDSELAQMRFIGKFSTNRWLRQKDQRIDLEDCNRSCVITLDLNLGCRLLMVNFVIWWQEKQSFDWCFRVQPHCTMLVCCVVDKEKESNLSHCWTRACLPLKGGLGDLPSLGGRTRFHVDIFTATKLVQNSVMRYTKIYLSPKCSFHWNLNNSGKNNDCSYKFENKYAFERKKT